MDLRQVKLYLYRTKRKLTINFFALASRQRRKDVHYASIEAGNASPIFTIVHEVLWVPFQPFLDLISTYWLYTVLAAAKCFLLARSPTNHGVEWLATTSVSTLQACPHPPKLYTQWEKNKTPLNIGGLPDTRRHNDPLHRRGRSVHAGLRWPTRIQTLFLSTSWRTSSKALWLVPQLFIRSRRNPTSLWKSSTPTSRSDVRQRRRVDVWWYYPVRWNA